MHYFIGNLGHVFVILAFVSSLITAFSYFKAAQLDKDLNKGWISNGRFAFWVHSISVIGVVVVLYTIIRNHYFEYHYAWAHSSIHLPTYYMISSFWEGQEGSFLLWMFWHSLIGLALIYTNKAWEAPVMTIFALVQGFLASMILGVVIFDIKIGSTPFILLRDVLNDQIFTLNPEFIPEDGTGLNPLLQNYWMVIHPPTLFLGFAGTLVPFAFVIAGLWKKKYTEWIRPALPWALGTAAVLGLGIMMGAYWAYETLNFGGYWNWDPVENAVYVPWLFLIAAIHTMLTARKSPTSLKTTIVLTILSFVLILYSTFLTRSGILGESSVHSFTDLGLSGQLLLYLVFFVIIAIIISWRRWKSLPANEGEISPYNRVFWILTGSITLCLMGFQVLIPTSIPVWNSIVELFGGVSNLAPPAEQVTFYSNIQIWFGIAVALISGAAQFFWWRKMNRENLFKEFANPVLITLVLSIIIMAIADVDRVSYILLLTAGVYTIVANGAILYQVFKNNFKVTGGSIAHFGIGLILIGIMFSSGYSDIISRNLSGVKLADGGSDEFESENIRLFIEEQMDMGSYQLQYLGQRLTAAGIGGYFDKRNVIPTADPYYVIALSDFKTSKNQEVLKGDTLKINPENTYYEIEYKNQKGRAFNLFPRIQMNEQMGGIIPSPDIKKYFGKDLYTHINGIPDPNIDIEWTKTVETRVKVGEQFFVKDYVTIIEEIIPLKSGENSVIGDFDVGIKAKLKVLGKTKDYYAGPYFVIKDMQVGSLPSTIEELGIRFSVINVHPESNEFTLGIQTTSKDYVILKAIEMPLINLLWTGTILTIFGMAIATRRRYIDFKQRG